MPTWLFEPGHTEAEFRARHMMVTSGLTRAVALDVKPTSATEYYRERAPTGRG